VVGHCPIQCKPHRFNRDLPARGNPQPKGIFEHEDSAVKLSAALRLPPAERDYTLTPPLVANTTKVCDVSHIETVEDFELKRHADIGMAVAQIVEQSRSGARVPGDHQQCWLSIGISHEFIFSRFNEIGNRRLCPGGASYCGSFAFPGERRIIKRVAPQQIVPCNQTVNPQLLQGVPLHRVAREPGLCEQDALAGVQIAIGDFYPQEFEYLREGAVGLQRDKLTVNEKLLFRGEHPSPYFYPSQNFLIHRY
jgi:hypothetical protein